MAAIRRDMTLQDLVDEIKKDPDKEFDLATYLSNGLPLDDEGNPYDPELGVKEIDSMMIENGVLVHFKGDHKDIKIPSDVISIKSNAFKRKEEIETIYIPRSVEHIAKGAFKGCKNLKKVTCPIKFEFEAIDIFGEHIDDVEFYLTVYMCGKDLVYSPLNGKVIKRAYYLDKALKD